MLKNKVSGKGRIIGILIGGVIGAVSALIFSPKSGKDLRKVIKKKTNGVYDDTEKLIGAAKVKAKDIMNSGLTMFSSAKDKTDVALNNGKVPVGISDAKQKTAAKSPTRAIRKPKKS